MQKSKQRKLNMYEFNKFAINLYKIAIYKKYEHYRRLFVKYSQLIVKNLYKGFNKY